MECEGCAPINVKIEDGLPVARDARSKKWISITAKSERFEVESLKLAYQNLKAPWQIEDSKRAKASGQETLKLACTDFRICIQKPEI